MLVCVCELGEAHQCLNWSRQTVDIPEPGPVISSQYALVERTWIKAVCDAQITQKLKDVNGLFNNTLNTFYLQLYSVGRYGKQLPH